jgi:hypothetical protein
MPRFIEIRGGEQGPQVQILDLEKVCLVVVEWAEGEAGGFSGVTVHFTGGVSTRFSSKHGAQEFMADFRQYLLTL